MAETQILPNSNLQINPSTCTSCIDSVTAGSEQGVNGNFNDYLDGSLKEGLSFNNGEVLPIDGKKLPLSILSGELSGINNKLLSLDNIPIDETQSRVSAETLDQVISTSVDNDLTDLHARLDNLSRIETISQELANQINLSDISKSIQKAVLPEVQNANELVAKVPSEVSNSPIPAVQTNTASVKSLQIDNLNPITNLIDYKHGNSSNRSFLDLEIQTSRISSRSDDDIGLPTPSQRLSVGESKSEKFYEYFSKNLSVDSAFRETIKSPVNNTELFQHNTNIYKSESVANTINTNSVADAYSTYNTANLQNKAVEAPIPLIVKQSIGLEQAQNNIDQSIAQNIKWMVGNKTQNAKINVFPESLGQVNIAINLDDSNLKINFIASSNVTRDLIEASISNLRNQFHESGINLQEVNVETRFSKNSDQNSHYSDQQDQNNDDYRISANKVSKDEDSIELHEQSTTSSLIHLLDAYA